MRRALAILLVAALGSTAQTCPQGTTLSGGACVSGGGSGNATTVNGAAVPTDGGILKTNGSGQLIDATAGTDYLATVPNPTTYTNNSLGTATADSAVYQNTTAAAAGAQQYSPAIHWIGQGWKTAATAASQTVEYRTVLVPVQASANPGAQLQFQQQINGGGWTTIMCAGGGSTSGQYVGINGCGGAGLWSGGNASTGLMGFSGVGWVGAANGGGSGNSRWAYTNSTGIIGWTSASGDPGTGTPDTGMERYAQKVVSINDGSGNGTLCSQSASHCGDLRVRHYMGSGGAPTACSSGCGTSPAFAGNDSAFTLNVGTGTPGSAVTATFANAWGNAPVCTANDQSHVIALQVASTTTNVTITASGAFAASDVLAVICQGY